MALRSHLMNRRRSIFTKYLQSTLSPPVRRREFKTSPVLGNRVLFRRGFLLPWRSTNLKAAVATTSSSRFPEFLKLPAGEKLRETVMKDLGGHSDDRMIRYLGIGEIAPLASEGRNIAGLTVEDARRILRASVVEKLKARLRAVGSDTVSYKEFVRICVDGCGSHARGMEFAKLLDESGNVIVFGDVVLLRPEQVVESMEALLRGSRGEETQNDTKRRKLLEELERQKAEIDEKAQSLARRELYFGLGLFTAQTVGLMRLTFWELSWDVMEPICFFVTSLHFMLAYAFFLRTSTEPSFEGFFQRRFKAKERKLIRLHNFDVEMYHKLCREFYPKCSDYSIPMEKKR